MGVGCGEMLQKAKVLVLVKDTGSAPSILMVNHNNPQLQFHGIRCPLPTPTSPAHMWSTDIYEDKTLIHWNKIKLKNKLIKKLLKKSYTTIKLVLFWISIYESMSVIQHREITRWSQPIKKWATTTTSLQNKSLPNARDRRKHKRTHIVKDTLCRKYNWSQIILSSNRNKNSLTLEWKQTQTSGIE